MGADKIRYVSPIKYTAIVADNTTHLTGNKYALECANIGAVDSTIYGAYNEAVWWSNVDADHIATCHPVSIFNTDTIVYSNSLATGGPNRDTNTCPYYLLLDVTKYAANCHPDKCANRYAVNHANQDFDYATDPSPFHHPNYDAHNHAFVHTHITDRSNGGPDPGTNCSSTPCADEDTNI